MRVAILESIVMPAGHEVEFDRILINELKRQGHEPVLFVPENFPFKVDYGVDVVYLEGGEVVTYAGASKWKKPFLSIFYSDIFTNPPPPPDMEKRELPAILIASMSR